MFENNLVIVVPLCITLNSKQYTNFQNEFISYKIFFKKQNIFPLIDDLVTSVTCTFHDNQLTIGFSMHLHADAF